ncbi:MAG: hypothetical protein ACOH1T_06105 [Microbacteriaceae bacterium]
MSANGTVHGHDSNDPTLVRNQPALVTSSGAIWLIVGGILAAISIAVLATLVMREPAGLAVGAIIVIVMFYLAMIVTKLAITSGRLRLGLLAGLMLAIAVVALITVVIVASTEWNAV